MKRVNKILTLMVLAKVGECYINYKIAMMRGKHNARP